MSVGRKHDTRSSQSRQLELEVLAPGLLMKQVGLGPGRMRSTKRDKVLMLGLGSLSSQLAAPPASVILSLRWVSLFRLLNHVVPSIESRGSISEQGDPRSGYGWDLQALGMNRYRSVAC